MNEHTWTQLYILTKLINKKQTEIDTLIKKKRSIESQLQSTEFLVKEVMNELEPIKLWKESLIDESDWFHISSYLDEEFWCSNTNPKYINLERFDFMEIKGKTRMRPKTVTDFMAINREVINKIKNDIWTTSK